MKMRLSDLVKRVFRVKESTVLVLCCNDSVEHVYVGTEEGALAKIDELARADFERNKHHWQNESRFGLYKDDAYATYRNRCYWHTHKCPLSVGP